MWLNSKKNIKSDFILIQEINLKEKTIITKKYDFH